MTTPWPPPPPPAPAGPIPPPPRLVQRHAATGDGFVVQEGPATAGSFDDRDDWDEIERQAATLKDGPAVVDAPPPQPMNVDLPKRYVEMRKQCTARGGLEHDHGVELLDTSGQSYARWIDPAGQAQRAPWTDLPQRQRLTVRMVCEPDVAAFLAGAR